MLAVQERRLLRPGVPAGALEGGYVSVHRECVQRGAERERACLSLPAPCACISYAMFTGGLMASCLVQDTKQNARPLESRLTLAWGVRRRGVKAAPQPLLLTRRWKLKYLSWYTTCPRA